MYVLGVMVHTFNLSTWEAKPYGSLWLPGQPGQHRNPYLKEKKEKRSVKSVAQW